MKYKVRVIKEDGRFYPQVKIQNRFEPFYSEAGTEISFSSVQKALDYMEEMLYPRQQDSQKKIVYQGEI